MGAQERLGFRNAGSSSNGPITRFRSKHQVSAQTTLPTDEPTLTRQVCGPGKPQTTGQRQRASRKRVLRTWATWDQVEILKTKFKQNPTPEAPERKKIAEEIKMSEEWVATWYKNK